MIRFVSSVSPADFSGPSESPLRNVSRLLSGAAATLLHIAEKRP